MHSTCLSRQDTLPTEDPSWSYPQVPGQPAPTRIPPRNEPVLYIPWANHTVDDSNTHAIAMCLKNLRNVKVHLPSPPANSESMNDDETVTQMTHAYSLGKDFFGPKPPFGLDDEALPLSAMAVLTIHTSPQTSGVVTTSSPISPQLGVTFNVSEKDGI